MVKGARAGLRTSPRAASNDEDSTFNRQVQLHGPASALEACALTEYMGVGVDGYAIASGFQKFELTGYNMGLLDLSKSKGGW